MPMRVWGAGSNQGADGDWNNPLNWDGDSIPVDGDAVSFNNTTGNNLTIGPSTSVTLVNFIVYNDYTGYVNFISTSTTGVIIDGGIYNYTGTPIIGNFSLLNCTGFSGLIYCGFFSRDGSGSPQSEFFQSQNITMSGTDKIEGHPINISSVNFRCSSTISESLVNFNILSEYNTMSFTYGIDTLNISSYLEIYSDTITLEGMLHGIPYSYTGLTITGDLYLYTSNLVVGTVSNPAPLTVFSSGHVYVNSVNSPLNIEVTGPVSSIIGQFSRFFQQSSFGPGIMGGTGITRELVFLSNESINYEQTGLFHFCFKEGDYNTNLINYNTIAFSHNTPYTPVPTTLSARGDSMVSGDSILPLNTFTTYTPSASGFVFYDNSIYAGTEPASITLYDNSKVYNTVYVESVPNPSTGISGLRIVFNDVGGMFGAYQYRQSNKASS